MSTFNGHIENHDWHTMTMFECIWLLKLVANIPIHSFIRLDEMLHVYYAVAWLKMYTMSGAVDNIAKWSTCIEWIICARHTTNKQMSTYHSYQPKSFGQISFKIVKNIPRLFIDKVLKIFYRIKYSMVKMWSLLTDSNNSRKDRIFTCFKLIIMMTQCGVSVFYL